MARVSSIYQRCAEDLQDHFGVEPSAETHALFNGLLKGAKVPCRPAHLNLEIIQKWFWLPASLPAGVNQIYLTRFVDRLDATMNVQLGIDVLRMSLERKKRSDRKQ